MNNHSSESEDSANAAEPPEAPRMEPNPTFSWIPTATLGLFIAVVAVLIWFSLRNHIMESVRETVDIGFSLLLCAAAACVPLRMIYQYTFRTTDLLLLACLWAGATAGTYSAAEFYLPYFYSETAYQDQISNLRQLHLIQYCLIVDAVLFLGSAIGLRSCKELNLQSNWKRAITLITATFSFPAVVGIFAFGAELVGIVLMFETEPNYQKRMDHSPYILILFGCSVLFTMINSRIGLAMASAKGEIGGNTKN